LQLRAANRKRPVISVSNTRRGLLDAVIISGAQGSRFVLDGLLIVGRGVHVSALKADATKPASGQKAQSKDDLCDVSIRHCTLVPGWSLDCDCEPERGAEPSLKLENTTARVRIEHSILGAIQVAAGESRTKPTSLDVSDSIWDATSNDLPALGERDEGLAYARLTVVRCTVFGKVRTHEIALAENCIFTGHICVARRQTGCVRFCYVPPGSRTPRRYECQPDLVDKAVAEKFPAGDERDHAKESERLRVEPQFNSTRYGTPTYCQLAATCAEEITRGADDESEMGAFHDLFQPQREANLRARLDEYTPAGMDAGIIYAT
jgi:hypothetical protein